MRIAVDTGGTFTDCVVLEGSTVKILKVFSTPEDSSRGILEGVQLLAGEPASGKSIEIIHGTTVGTNALLERSGARVALVTTAGFEDLIEIGRQNRPRLYDLNVWREPPLVPRSLRWGVHERTAATGKILEHPQSRELRKICRAIRTLRAESVAVCFLFSFRNIRNERMAALALRRLGLPVSVSHEVLPEFREYERLSTVVINAYLAPGLGWYLSRLSEKVARAYFGGTSHFRQDAGAALAQKKTRAPVRSLCKIYVMQSNGGITTAARAAREPVRTILSGPAGGVVATSRLAKILGIKRTMSFDMGGTSTDVCLLDGDPRTTSETTLAGLPISVPVLDVHSVGAGGGSMARVDAGGALRVGPESAGALPGPICYARGGECPTVTDAHLLLGRLDPDHFLAGTFKLDSPAVEKQFAEFLRAVPRTLHARIPRSPLELARGMVAVSTATIERALRLISVERGYDPRDFTLISYGGAGGLHAADLARALGLPGVIVPVHPGAFSALGILLSDVVKEVSQSVLLTVPSSAEARRRGASASKSFRALMANLGHRFESIERKARAEFLREHFNLDPIQSERRIALRYVGQAYELSIPFNPRFPVRFHAQHERTYGYAQPMRPIEIVNLQVKLALPTPKLSVRIVRSKIGDTRKAMVKRKPVYFDNKFFQTPIYDRQGLKAGAKFRGPAIVVEYSSTTVFLPDFTCLVDTHLNLMLSQHAN